MIDLRAKLGYPLGIVVPNSMESLIKNFLIHLSCGYLLDLGKFSYNFSHPLSGSSNFEQSLGCLVVVVFVPFHLDSQGNLCAFQILLCDLSSLLHLLELGCVMANLPHLLQFRPRC